MSMWSAPSTPVAVVRNARLVGTLLRLERRQHPGALHPGLWRRGFLSNRAYLYPGIADRSVPYISDVAVERRLSHIHAPTARVLLEDKLVFYETLVARGMAARAPEVFGVVLAGRFRPRAPLCTDRLRAQDRVVLKPVSGGGGRGVRVVGGPDAVASAEAAGGDVLVQELVSPAPDWAGSSDRCLNTMRLVVLRSNDGQPVLAGAVHRFGTTASGFVDNIGAGGLCSRIDLVDGRLGPAVGLPRRARRVEHDVHPDTGRRLTGAVTQWGQVRDLALNLMVRFPEVDHVGWELCLSDRGPLVVEGNGSTPNLNVLPFHGPFLHDDRVRAFYQHHGLRPS